MGSSLFVTKTTGTEYICDLFVNMSRAGKVQWDQCSPGNSASHYSDQNMNRILVDAAIMYHYVDILNLVAIQVFKYETNFLKLAISYLLETIIYLQKNCFLSLLLYLSYFAKLSLNSTQLNFTLGGG